MRLALIAALMMCRAGPANAAGFRFIDVPAEGSEPAKQGAIWYPCTEPAQDIALGPITVRGVMNCPIGGAAKLPLVVISHGLGGGFLGHHDTAEALADSGFAVAAISHPGDNFQDMSGAGDLKIFVERPAHIKRLIDFMLGASPLAPRIDAERVGFFGFSRGGLTGLTLIGAKPQWSAAKDFCAATAARICHGITDPEMAKRMPPRDPRIKAAVIADPLAIFFNADSYAGITVPTQLWSSEQGGDGVAPATVALVNERLPQAHEFHVVPKSAHFAFLAPCPPALAADAPRICNDAPDFDRVAFHRQLDGAVVEFFRAHL